VVKATLDYTVHQLKLKNLILVSQYLPMAKTNWVKVENDVVSILPFLQDLFSKVDRFCDFLPKPISSADEKYASCRIKVQ